MKPTVVFGAMLFLLGAQPAHAVKLLTPNTDSCRTFVGLMQHFSSSQEALQLVSMSGWVTGFMSGIAEGTNVDILRELDITEITTRVIQVCEANPDISVSEAAERTAGEMLRAHGVTVK